MNLYPAIDLLDGQVVRLERGGREAATVYETEPLEAVRRFAAAGACWLHVVDLNRAFGDGASNLAHVRAVIEEASRHSLRVQVGGGLRDVADLEDVFTCGAARVVVGTVAAVDPSSMKDLAARYGGRLAVALDARDGEIVVKGWTAGTGRRVHDLARELVGLGVRCLVYTDVGRDGTLVGPDVEGAAVLGHATAVPVIVSGGVGDLSHVAAATAAGIAGLVVGRALYDGRLDLVEALDVAGPQEGV